MRELNIIRTFLPHIIWLPVYYWTNVRHTKFSSPANRITSTTEQTSATVTPIHFKDTTVKCITNNGKYIQCSVEKYGYKVWPMTWKHNHCFHGHFQPKPKLAGFLPPGRKTIRIHSTGHVPYLYTGKVPYLEPNQ